MNSLIDNKEEDKVLLLKKVLESNDNDGNLTMMDFTPGSSKMLDRINTFARNASEIDAETYKKYKKYGIEWDADRFNSGLLDIELARRQSNWEKLGHAIEQTVVNEIVLGTALGFSDLYDIVVGELFKSDNNYQNPVSAYLENLQEEFKNNHDIYQDPTKTGWKDWSDFGWWMNNVPSIASSLTLMIPGAGVGKIASLAGKTVGKGIRATTGFTRKAFKAAKYADKAEDLTKVGKLENWLNRPNVGKISNDILEITTNGTTMRLLENYQESRQTYKDMMDDATEYLENATDKEKEDFIKRNKELFDKLGVDTSNSEEMAKAVAKEAADKTFQIDMANLIFDVIQVATLRNPLKLPKNLRTTARVNKAQREAKVLAKFKTPEEGAAYLANRSFKEKAKDFITDHAKSRWIIASEATEGIEEVVNYVAQQEGINYGKLLLDPTTANIHSADRWNSYLTSSALYESAFWGILGGVMFQQGVSGIRKVNRATINTIRKNKDFNENSLEGNETGKKTNWLSEYRLAEDALRTEEINSRYGRLEKLKKRRNTIYNEGKSPFEDDSPEKGKQLDLTTQIEKDVTWQRAVDDFIVDQTFDAIDAGNFDLLKEYLRNPNVMKALEDITLDENNPAPKINVEDLISRMDEVEKIYTDNLITVNSFAGNVKNTPFEYINIIARDNTKAQIKEDRIQNKINNYNQSAEANEFRFKDSLEEVFGTPNLNYKTAVALVTAANYLQELRSAKQEILNDPKSKGSVDGQNAIRIIDSRINVINNYVKDLGSIFSDFKTNENLFGVINTLFTTQKSLPIDSDEYLDLEKAIATRDIETINKITDSKFELTDDEIVKVFGETDTKSGAYYLLSDELVSHFGVDPKSKEKLSKFVEAAPNLADDYSIISALNIAKLIEHSKIANTQESVNTRIHSINNIMNKARKAAVQTSRDTLVKNAKKYGRQELLNYVFNNESLTNVSSEDKKEIDDALAILNLTSPNNEQLAEIIRVNILLGDYEGSVEKAKAEKKSSTFEKRDNKTKKQKRYDNPLNETKVKERQNLGTVGENDNANISNQTNHIQVTNTLNDDNSDGGLTFNVVGVNEEDSIPFKEVDLGDDEGYELQVNDANNVNRVLRDKLVKNTSLFDGYDSNNTNGYRIVENPVLAKDNNSNLFLHSKGVIEYKEAATKKGTQAKAEEPQIAYTGEEDKPNASVTDEDEAQYNSEYDEREDYNDIDDYTDEDYEREQEALERNERAIELIRNLYDDSSSLLTEYEQGTKTQEEFIAAVQEKVDKFREETEYDDQYELNINGILELVKIKPDLIKIAKVVNDIKSSTLVEKEKGKYTQEFINSIYALIEEYTKAAKIDKHKGKYYINFEDFIRNINNLYDGIYEGEAIYKKLRDFLTSEYNTLVVVIDDINDSNLLENARKSIEQRIKEKIGARSNYRVGIDELFENPTPEFIKAFNSLKIGSKLKLKKVGTRFNVMKGNVVVGIMAIPSGTDQGDGYTIRNKGWLTTVYSKESGKKSPLHDVLVNLAENDEVNSLINSLLYGELDASTKEETIENAFNLIQPLSNGLLEVNANKKDAIDFICNIWRYRMGAADFSKPADQRKFRIDKIINPLFEKLYDSYDAVNKAATEKKKDLEIEVAHINDGELIRIIDEKDIDLKARRQTRNNYDKFTQSNSAFVNPKSCKIGVVTDTNTLTSAPNDSVEHTKLGRKGTVHVIIPNRSGVQQYCIATSVAVDDKKLDINSDAYKIIQASREYLKNTIDGFLQNPSDKNFKNLSIVISDLMNHNSRNASLFDGVGIKLTNDTIVISLPSKGVVINRKSFISDTDFVYTEISPEGVLTDYNYTYEEDGDLLRNTILEALDSCVFNVDFNFVTNKYSFANNSTIGFTDKGKFTIKVGSFRKTYSNLSEAFIQGGLLRVNTRIEEGSNYRRKGQKQGGNQILELSINKITSSPVEKNTPEEVTPAAEQKSIAEQERTAEYIINTEDANDVVDILVDNALPELEAEDKQSLKDLGLLPKAIVFQEEITDNDGNPAVAENNLTTKTVKVSRLFLNMYDGIGEQFTNKDFNRKQAIRKLIHEQVHSRIKEQGREDILKQIKDIYTQFEDYVNTLEDKELEFYEGFLFKDKKKEEERLEEFLVESFTSINLANKLNEIEAKYKEGELDTNKAKETIWDKILKLIARIFNYNIYKDGKIDVNKESLLQKELYALAGAINISSNETTQETEQDEEFLEDDIDLDGEGLYSTNIERLDTTTRQPEQEATKYTSTLIESAPIHSSTSAFVASFEPSLQPTIANLINSGEISSFCK